VIRIATHDDIPSLLELGRAMHAESRYAVHAWDDEKVAALIGALIATDDGLALVVEFDGVIVGGFLGSIDEHYFTRARVASDFAMFVSPDQRGGHFAVQLLEHYVAWARARGAAMIQVGVTTGVQEAATARLFNRCGFDPVGQLFEVAA
jgi:GNAT superfamily N-acetyltransferase